MSDEKKQQLELIAEEKKQDDVSVTSNEVKGEELDSVTTLEEKKQDDVPITSNEVKSKDIDSILSENEKTHEENIVSSDNKKKEINKWYAPLNRKSLVDMLAGGVLAPYNYYSRSNTELQCFSDSGILLIKSGLSQDILDSPELVGEKGFTVLVEIDLTGLPATKLQGINDNGKSCKVTVNDSKHSVILSYPAIFPLTRIIKVHFRSESDKRNFIARSFDNVPIDKNLLSVSEELFTQDFSCNIKTFIKSFCNDDGDNNLKSSYTNSDSYVGSAALLITTLPPKSKWLEFAKEMFTSKRAVNFSGALLSKIIVNNLERELFLVAFSIMQKMDTREGWQSKKVLQYLHSSIDKSKLTEDEKNQLDHWLISCEEILDNKRQVSHLTDQGMKVGRAILLLLLRPEPEEILDSVHSSLEPGMEVMSIAAMLSGARMGFEELSNSIKLKTPMHELLTCLKADISNITWDRSILKKKISTPVVDIKIDDCGDLVSSYKLLVDGAILAENRDEGPIELRLIHTKAESVGIKLRYERENNRLSYRYELPVGRTQNVYVSPGIPNNKNEKTIRFSSPCLDISTTKGKRILNRAMCDTLLIKNCEPNLYCRFAICEVEKMVVVLSDQILDTIDNTELLMGLEHVAKTADAFEEEVGLDQF